jgi:tRNA-splicing ligase RtcB
LRMSAVKLPFRIDQFENISLLRNEIERAIPLGHYGNTKITATADDAFLSLGLPRTGKFDSYTKLQKPLSQLGSLGWWNHFIEICYDQHGGSWVMLHSGSRGIGKQLADIHINSAKSLMQKYFIDLPDPDLAYLVQNTPNLRYICTI